MCPDLYSLNEVQAIATHMSPGQIKTTRPDKVESNFLKFLEGVKVNLHVIVLLNCTGLYSENWQ